MTKRLEIRLNDQLCAQLAELTCSPDSSASEVVRFLIDNAYEQIMLERRRRAVERLASLRIEEMPDPEELSRQLNNKYEPLDIP